MLKAFWTEVIGTYFLIAIIFLLLSLDPKGAVPWLIGLGLWILVWGMGPVSGAQFNPSVSLATCLKDWISIRTAVQYLFAQFLGLIAAVITNDQFFYGNSEMASSDYFQLQPSEIVVGEFAGTFALVLVIMLVVKAKNYKAFLFYGFCIGLTVAFFAFLVGSISGAAFNPAVSVAFLLSGYYSAFEAVIAIATQLFAALAAYHSSQIIDKFRLNS